MKVLRNFILISGLAISGLASGGTFSCSGQVTNIAFSPKGGLLQVNAGHGVHYLCSLKGEYNGVHPEVCKSWYSMFLTAQASGREIHQSYNSSHGTASSATNCAELGSWKTPDPFPYFVQIKDQ